MLDNEIKKILEEYCNKVHGGSQEKASQALGISKPTFWRWINLKARPKIETLIPVFEALDLTIVSTPPTIQRMGANAPVETIDDSKEVQTIDVHILAGAGKPWELCESEPIFSVDVPLAYLKKSDYSAVIDGDSMYPTIKNNAVVGIKQNVEFKSNEIYLTRLPYHGVMVKRVSIDLERKKYIIKSDNQDKENYPNIEIDIEEAENLIEGKVVWVWQNV